MTTPTNIPVYVKVGGNPKADDKDATGLYETSVNSTLNESQRADVAIALVKDVILLDQPAAICFVAFDANGKRLDPEGCAPAVIEDGSHVRGRVWEESYLSTPEP